jgi:hypothetical protein
MVSRLGLPHAVKTSLRRLSPQRALRAQIAVRMIDPAGNVTKRRQTVSLPGQAG